MTLTFNEISTILGLPPMGDGTVSGIAIDSRNVAPGDLFCCIVGARVDGHEFASDAVQRGAFAILATRPLTADVPVYQVESIETALAKIGGLIRSTFPGKVVGVTGSVGKTTVKEYLAAALGGSNVLKTEGNLNTEFGVPVCWMKLLPQHQFAVIEMAMRGLGQIAHLCSFSKPHIGVVTSLGSAHIGELGGLEQIARAKAEILASLPHDGVAIIPADDDNVQILRACAACSVLTFGRDVAANYRIESWNVMWESGETTVEFSNQGSRFQTRVKGLGYSAARNGVAALAAAVACGVDMYEASQAIVNATVPAGRLKILTLGGATLISDVYNSSPESCAEALANLSQFPAAGRRIAVLGDMMELGPFAESMHKRVGALVAESGIDVLYLVGAQSEWIGEGAVGSGFKGQVARFSNAFEARRLFEQLQPGDVVLLKASRSVELENAIPNLEAKHA